MKNSHRAAASAAALLAAGIVGVSSANVASATAPICGPAKADRISSAQLKDSIANAAAREKQGSTAPLSVHPLGGWPPPGSSAS
jgi:hypothetical protein